MFSSDRVDPRKSTGEFSRALSLRLETGRVDFIARYNISGTIYDDDSAVIMPTSTGTTYFLNIFFRLRFDDDEPVRNDPH